jgi:hypothetical protein
MKIYHLILLSIFASISLFYLFLLRLEIYFYIKWINSKAKSAAYSPWEYSNSMLKSVYMMFSYKHEHTYNYTYFHRTSFSQLTTKVGKKLNKIQNYLHLRLPATKTRNKLSGGQVQ